MTDDAPERPARRWGWLLYVPSVVLLIVFSIANGAGPSESGAGQTPAPLPRPQAKKLFVRVCQTAEREGFERYGDLSEPRLIALVQRVVREMRARGELPPA
jgi:hypothetical protein